MKINIERIVIDTISRFTSLEKKDIGLHSEIQSDLALDSLEIINVIVSLESELNTVFPDEKLAIGTSFTVENLVEALETTLDSNSEYVEKEK